MTSSEIQELSTVVGLYKRLNVCISDNLDFVAIHCSIHVLHLGGASFLTDRGRSSGKCLALCMNTRAFNTITFCIVRISYLAKYDFV